jgi:sugar/nucleoside kinase (ribokinase family)
MTQLICAGEAFEDLIFVGLERLPELGEEVKTDHFTATIGGGAVITAVKAARLGMKTTLISALGDAAIKTLSKERLTITNLRKRGEPHAITAALSTGDDRAFVTYNGVNAKLEARLAKQLAMLSRRSSPGAIERGLTHLHLCFYPHDCRYWAELATKLRLKGITTSWDFGWNEPLTNDRGLTDLIDSLDFLFVNDREARLYTGASSLQDAILEWRKRTAITIIKLGDQGAAWLAPDRDILVPASAVKAIDTTGAGDSFNAGFLVAWMTGKTPEQCLAAGNRLGSTSTRHAGGV